MKQGSTVLETLVNRGTHNMTGRFVEQLDDVLSQIGLNRSNTKRLKVIVHLKLLAEHALAFNYGLNAIFFNDTAEHLINIVSRRCPMHLRTVGAKALLRLKEIFVQPAQHVGLYGSGPVPPQT